ncbi:MAG: ABC1 kinase family protein [Sporolactobacillus sp.]
MIGKHIRHIKRYREIVTVLVKYGFGYIVRDVGLFHLLSLPKQIVSDFSSNNDSAKPLAGKIRSMLEELGPTFIKLGQMLSLRSDIIPEQIADELRKLQDEVTPIDPNLIKTIIHEQLGAPVEELFAEFDENCLAAASIAQVHRATLTSGEKIVVKIRRPNIDMIVSNDIEILWDLASLVEKRYAWARDLQLTEIVGEFSTAIQSEMDYFHEGRSTDKLHKFFDDNPNVTIPKVFWDYSTNQLLTLEYVQGLKLDDLIQSDSNDLDKKLISERIVRSFLDQALVVGVFHGDPHPGNLFFFPDNRIAYIDFGQVGTLSEEMKANFSSLIIGLMRGDIDMLQRTILEMSTTPEGLDERQFKADLGVLREHYYDLPFKDVHIGQVMHDVFELTKKHHILIPTNYTLLGKALITLEGMINSLDNQISILELAEPYGRKLLLNRLNPERMAKKWFRSLTDALENTVQIPTLLKKTLQHLYSGKTHVEMELPQLDLLLSKLDRVANRIAFSIILLAFSIILGGLIIGETLGSHPFLTHIPILDIAVTVIIFMYLLVLLAIFRSGKF